MKRVVVVKGGIDGCPDKLSTGDTASISSPGAVSGILSADCYGIRDVICRSVHSGGPNLVIGSYICSSTTILKRVHFDSSTGIE